MLRLPSSPPVHSIPILSSPCLFFLVSPFPQASRGCSSINSFLNDKIVLYTISWYFQFLLEVLPRLLCSQKYHHYHSCISSFLEHFRRFTGMNRDGRSIAILLFNLLQGNFFALFAFLAFSNGPGRGCSTCPAHDHS